MPNIEDIAGRFLVPLIIRSADDACKFWSRFQQLNPTFDRLYECLLKERATLKTWVTQMNAAGYVGTSFWLGVKWKDVHVHLVKLQQYMSEAEGRYAYLEETVVDSQREVSKYLARIKFIKAGCNDLDDIVRAMEAINAALSEISPPPPPYVQDSSSRSLSEDRELANSRAANVQELGRGQDELMAKPVQVDTLDRCTFPPSVSKPQKGQHQAAPINVSSSSKQTTHASIAPPAHDQADVTSQQMWILKPSFDGEALDETCLNLKDVYSLCLEALGCIARSDDGCRKLAHLMRSRLKLWGVGLFQGSASLDVLLHDDQLNCDRTRESLNKYMIVLLSHIDVVLKAIVEDRARTATTLLDILVNVQTLLSNSAAQTYILKQWQINFVDNLMHDHTDTNDNTSRFEMLPERQADGVAHDAGYERDTIPSSEARKTQHMKSAGRLIETLFQLLPVFEILRSKFWQERSRAAAKAAKDTVSTQRTSSATRMQLSKSSQTNLVAVQRYITERDMSMEREDRKAVMFGPVFKKQQERLEEYRWSIGTQKQTEVDRQIEGLLASLVRDIESKNRQKGSKALQPQLVVSSASIDALDKHAKRSEKKEQDMMLRDFVEGFEQILMP